MNCRRVAAATSLLSLLGACGPIATVRGDGSVIHHYFGYVKVEIPPTYSSEGSVHAVKTASVGIQVGNGLGVGYFHDQRVAVPLDCRLVVLVRTQAQLDHAVETLSRIHKGGLCAAVDRD